MDESSSKTKLAHPLPKQLVDFIMEEQPHLGSFLISTIEFTIKESANHYADVLRSVEPLLKANAKNFVSKIFLFKKRMCRTGAACTQKNCIFLHEGVDELPTKRVTFELSSPKVFRNQNSEIVFNKVNESVFSIEDVREYAEKYGPVSSLRRLNRGKYLIIYDKPETAQKLVECTEPVLGDRDIKKFYNVNVQSDQYKKIDINHLLQEQRDIINKMNILYDSELISSLKLVTHRIRNYILTKEGKSDGKMPKKDRTPRPDPNVESSLYYNMFAE